MNTKEFIERAKEIHGNKYEYSKTEYINPKTKVCITCPKHGDFLQSPYKHLSGQGCKKCAYEKTNEWNTISKEEFINRARRVHGEKYDYSNVEFKKYNTDKVAIICPIHGEFRQTPASHCNGRGCPKCGIEASHATSRKSQEQFIEEATKKHNGFYSYDKVIYKSTDEKVIVTCPIHGDFLVSPYKHIHRGDGCPKCRYIKSSEKERFTTDTFIEKAKKIHGDKYDYSKSEYTEYQKPVIITCKIHGDFTQTPDVHLRGCGCQKCSNQLSKKEQEIYEFLCGLLGEENVKQRDRTVLDKREIDILIPSKHIGIEYNGLYWHSEWQGKDRNYHLSKTEEARGKGYGLIHIFEDEYLQHPEIVKNKLKHILGLQSGLPKIPARKCEITEITYKESTDFLNEYHIQGSANGTVYLGALYNGYIVGVMVFKQEKKGSDKWELSRFSTDHHYICQGLGGKLFKYFVRKYNPSEVKSFADKRWTVNSETNLYTKLGFVLEKRLKPDYYYILGENKELCRIHKFNFRKEYLNKKYGLPMSLTESEMAEKIGAHKVWNCGLLKYVWRKQV